VTPFRSFAEQARRNRFAALARTVPVAAGMVAVAAGAPFFGGTFLQRYLTAVVASHLVRHSLHRLWWLASAPVFGMRVVADKRGSGRPLEARIDGDRLRVRGAVGWGASVDLAPRAEATSRLRVWLGCAVEVVVFASLATAAGLLLPEPYGWACAAGIALGTVAVVAPYPVSSTPGWFLFAMPFADRAAFDRVTRSTAEVKVAHLLAVGDAAAAAEALGQLGRKSWSAQAYNAELAVLTLDLDRIPPDTGFAWFAIAPSGPDRARTAQQRARLLAYTRETKLESHSPRPASFPVYLNELHWLAAVGSTLAPPHPTTDATALFLLTGGSPGPAALEADRAAYHSRSPITAADALCTAAIAYSIARKPEPAARALRQAKELVPGLRRIAIAEPWVDMASGKPFAAARSDAQAEPDPDRDAALSPDAYRARYATDEEAWKW
jgi:hypothetical protein